MNSAHHQLIKLGDEAKYLQFKKELFKDVILILIII